MTEMQSQTKAAEPPKTASAAQVAANRENAQLSTGPTSPEGRAASSQNRRSHGLTGRMFFFLDFEDPDHYCSLSDSIYAEYNPQTDTEQRLADAMIQHQWLKMRAIGLQEQLIMFSPNALEVDPKKLSLFLRYQTTQERSYYKAEKELQNLKKTKQKDEIGFESQKRASESHDAKIRLANARAHNLESAAATCKAAAEPKVLDVMSSVGAPFTFEELTQAFSRAIAVLVQEKEQQAAA